MRWLWQRYRNDRRLHLSNEYKSIKLERSLRVQESMAPRGLHIRWQTVPMFLEVHSPATGTGFKN